MKVKKIIKLKSQAQTFYQKKFILKSEIKHKLIEQHLRVQ